MRENAKEKRERSQVEKGAEGKREREREERT